MARLARIVVPGLPHHITQRGNRREAIFFEDGDHEIDCDLLAEQTLPRWVKPIGVTPTSSTQGGDGLGISSRAALPRWPLPPTHLIRAVRYVSLNPVRAGLVARAEDWRWSSVRAHMAGENDTLVNVRPVLERVQSFKTLLEPRTGEEFGDLRDAKTTGRPLGTPEFIHGLEAILGRSIARRAPGRKPVRDSQPPCEQLELL